MPAAMVEWPNVKAETINYLLTVLAPDWDGLEVAGLRPGATVGAEQVPFLQVEVDGTEEDYPVSRDNLMRLTAYHHDMDLSRDLAEAGRGALMALTETPHATLRVVADDNSGAPLEGVDQISDLPVCSVLVRIHTRPSVV